MSHVVIRHSFRSYSSHDTGQKTKILELSGILKGSNSRILALVVWLVASVVVASLTLERHSQMSKKHNHVTRFKLPTLSRTKIYIKYAIHTLRDQYHKTSADVVLLIDAKNAFEKSKCRS